MATILEVRDALIEKLETIPNIGIVDNADGRKEGLLWGVNTPEYVLPLWVVKLKTRNISPSIPRSLGAKSFDSLWEIKGYFPHFFEAGSENILLEYYDEIENLLMHSPALSVCELTQPPSLLENGYVYYKMNEESVLCHYLEIEFQTQAWRTNP